MYKYLDQKQITVKWQNIKGETLESNLDNMEPLKCFQHRIRSYLNGVTLTKETKLKWDMAIKRKDKLDARG